MKGWDPLTSEDWPAIAAVIPRPWPVEAARHDLRWHATVERLGGPAFPSRRWFAGRWGFTEHAARTVLASGEWADSAHPPVERFAHVSPRLHPTVAQTSPNTATANADNQPVSAHVSPSGHPAVTQDSPRARSSSHNPQPQSTTTDQTPKPLPAVAHAAVYNEWRSSHPRAPERPTPANLKALRAIVVECETEARAIIYMRWVAKSPDTYAAQLRGVTPWQDGIKVTRDDLVSLSRQVPKRLPLALAWYGHGAGTVNPADASKSPGTAEWHQACTAIGQRQYDSLPDDSKEAVKAAGGTSAILRRDSFTEKGLRERFCARLAEIRSAKKDT